MHILEMFITSSADVFRTKQAVADLSHQAVMASPQILARIAKGGRETGPADLLRHVAGDGIFVVPRDEDMLSAVLLAAALPDDDFPAFTTATVLLLLDRLRNGGGRDDLYWNWDAFGDHYRLAAPPLRAAIMCGFRALTISRGLYLSHPPLPSDCLTEQDYRSPQRLSDTEAGRLWQDRSMNREPLNSDERRFFRHLVEREAGMSPSQPETCPTVPPLSR
jgi:hypothetical protein